MHFIIGTLIEDVIVGRGIINYFRTSGLEIRTTDFPIKLGKNDLTTHRFMGIDITHAPNSISICFSRKDAVVAVALGFHKIGVLESAELQWHLNASDKELLLNSKSLVEILEVIAQIKEDKIKMTIRGADLEKYKSIVVYPEMSDFFKGHFYMEILKNGFVV